MLITGAGSGLGRASAIKLASEGAKLSLVDVNKDGLEETRDFIMYNDTKPELLLLEADVSNEDSVKKYVKDTLEHFNRLDGFYNNAGIVGKKSLIGEYDSSDFLKVVDINLNGVFYGLKYVLPVMRNLGKGTVINTASVAGIRGIVNQPAYVATKHGVAGLTKNAAIEYAKFGISVNAVAPGPILTRMLQRTFQEINPTDWEAAVRDHARGIPAQRLGDPEEVANLVAFLLSGEAAFINGAVIPIDGGQSSNQYAEKEY